MNESLKDLFPSSASDQKMHCCLCTVLFYEGRVGEHLLPRELNLAKVLASAAICTGKQRTEQSRQLGALVKLKLCSMANVLQNAGRVQGLFTLVLWKEGPDRW